MYNVLLGMHTSSYTHTPQPVVSKGSPCGIEVMLNTINSIKNIKINSLKRFKGKDSTLSHSDK